MANWDEVKQKVEKNGNVVTLTMEDLRDAHGVARLGVNVRAEISNTLAGMGLGHVPTELPSLQNEQVRVYKKGTSAGELIDTVLTTGEQNDAKIINQFAKPGTDYAAVVQKIRDIVAE
jgi:hypothetical protein